MTDSKTVASMRSDYLLDNTISQEALAKKYGVDRSTVSRIIANQSQYDVAYALELELQQTIKAELAELVKEPRPLSDYDKAYAAAKAEINSGKANNLDSIGEAMAKTLANRIDNIQLGDR